MLVKVLKDTFRKISIQINTPSENFPIGNTIKLKKSKWLFIWNFSEVNDFVLNLIEEKKGVKTIIEQITEYNTDSGENETFHGNQKTVMSTRKKFNILNIETTC